MEARRLRVGRSPAESIRKETLMLDRLRHPVLAIGFLLTLLVVPFDAGFAQQRGPSTPEERTRVVEVARALEQSPLDKDNKKGREGALAWRSEERRVGKE